MVILGNKGDMVHLRQVSSEEGKESRKKIFFSGRGVGGGGGW